MVESSFLSFLFSTTNFTTRLLIPNVDIDLNIAVKFLKLPNKAIPEGLNNQECKKGSEEEHHCGGTKYL